MRTVDLVRRIKDELGEDEFSPFEFYLTKKNGETVILHIDELVSDETGTIGIYLKED